VSGNTASQKRKKRGKMPKKQIYFPLEEQFIVDSCIKKKEKFKSLCVTHRKQKERGVELRFKEGA
jgi:hypothetical protein